MTQSQIEDNIKKIIFKHLSPKKYKIFVYGSRATGRARKWSDYDIGVIGNRPISTMTKVVIEDELEDSGVPVNVEVVDFHDVSQDFKRIALLKTIPWTTI